MIDINHINEQIQQILSEKIENELQTENLQTQINEVIARIAQEKVDATVTALLNRLVDNQQLNEKINQRINNDVGEQISRAISERVAESASRTDIATLLGQTITDIVEDRLDRAALPEQLIPWKTVQWKNFQLPADCISPGTVRKFSSTGIQDIASEINLTVADGRVIVEGETVSKNLTVIEKTTVNDLTVSGDITVAGSVNFQKKDFADQITGIVDNRIAEAKKNSLNDLSGSALMSNGTTLLTESSIGKSIVNSNLRTVGRLKNLSVAGETALAETVHIEHGRAGFNTDEPDGVITAWDEEAEITVKKYRNRTMYVGSTRGCDIVLGVSNNRSLTITNEGVETNSIKLGNITVTSSKTRPAHRAAPGDMVFNEKAGKGDPWAWRCLGNNTWIELYQ